MKCAQYLESKWNLKTMARYKNETREANKIKYGLCALESLLFFFNTAGKNCFLYRTAHSGVPFVAALFIIIPHISFILLNRMCAYCSATAHVTNTVTIECASGTTTANSTRSRCLGVFGFNCCRSYRFFSLRPKFTRTIIKKTGSTMVSAERIEMNLHGTSMIWRRRGKKHSIMMCISVCNAKRKPHRNDMFGATSRNERRKKANSSPENIQREERKRLK